MITAFSGLLKWSGATFSHSITLIRQLSDGAIDASGNSWLKILLLILVFVAVVAAVMWAAARRFRREAQRRVDALFSRAAQETIITVEMTAHLPQIVQRWMHRAEVVGKPIPNKLVVRQRGMLRTKADSRWMPFEAQQYFTINPPGFVWVANIHAAPFIRIGGTDSYDNGHGNMVIKPLYLFNAADGKGKEIDQGTLVRYLAEMAWFPQGAASRYLRWQSLNDLQALVTMEYGGISASGIYFFNGDGDVVGFQAKRYGDFGGIYRKEMWSVKSVSFATVGGMRIADKSECTWKLPEGDFHWLTMEVTDISPG